MVAMPMGIFLAYFDLCLEVTIGIISSNYNSGHTLDMYRKSSM